MEEDERSEDVREAQNVRNLPSGQAGPATAMARTPETPQLDSNSLFAPRAELDRMSLQTPAPALQAGSDMDMHESAVSPGASAAKSAQSLFLASVLQGAHIPMRQVRTHACPFQE